MEFVIFLHCLEEQDLINATQISETVTRKCNRCMASRGMKTTRLCVTPPWHCHYDRGEDSPKGECNLHDNGYKDIVKLFSH
jgi:hypothetical protein